MLCSIGRQSPLKNLLITQDTQRPGRAFADTLRRIGKTENELIVRGAPGSVSSPGHELACQRSSGRLQSGNELPGQMNAPPGPGQLQFPLW